MRKDEEETRKGRRNVGNGWERIGKLKVGREER